MRRTNYFPFDTRYYETHLSSLGKKVLNVLIQNWNKDRNLLQSDTRQRYPSNSHNKSRVSNRNHVPRIPSPPFNFEEPVSANHCYKDTCFNRNAEEANIPTTMELVMPINTVANGIEPASTYNLKNPVIDGNSQLNARSNHSYGFNPVSQNHDTHEETVLLATQINTVDFNKSDSIDVNWDDMFDSELFPDPKHVTEDALKTNLFEIKFPNDKADKSKTRQRKLKSNDSVKENEDVRSKRTQKVITDHIPKKVKKPSEPKPNYRKQKYTVVVKNWLDDVNTNNAEEIKPKDNIEGDVLKNTAGNENLGNLIVEKKSKPKSNKKVVQSRLANKGGIMKFDKPVDEKNKPEIADKDLNLEPNEVPNRKARELRRCRT